MSSHGSTPPSRPPVRKGVAHDPPRPRAVVAGDGVVSGPNKHGVYADAERIELLPIRKAWQGVACAEIAVGLIEGEWRSVHSHHFFTGDHWGSSSPLTALAPGYTTRADAITGAGERLTARIAGRTGPEAERMRAWVAGLSPDQTDLFGIAA